MKRQKRKAKAAGGQKMANQENAGNGGKKVSRRDSFRTFGEWGALAAVVVAGGWYAVDYVVGTVGELDLTKIGNGKPTIVQIHDPNCPRCVELQGETRDALGSIDNDELQYLVANIRSESGRAFAEEQGVGHVTLLLFDGKGQRLNVLVGNNSSETLERAFRRLLQSASTASAETS